MSMIELDIVTLSVIAIICLLVYIYCLKCKPYWLKYVSIGFMSENVFVIQVLLYVLLWFGVVLICIVELADLLGW